MQCLGLVEEFTQSYVKDMRRRMIIEVSVSLGKTLCIKCIVRFYLCPILTLKVVGDVDMWTV